MKKSVVILLLLGILLVSPLALTQEQAQTYTNFNRFVDNVRLFFSSGDNKVMLSLEVREKEVNSAIENIRKNNGKEANENLESALNKLVIVQEKVSPEIAEEVTASVDEIMEIIEESNLTKTLDRYVLEEKKTQLVAELVVEVEGSEGQTLTREVVQNENENRKMVKIVVQNEKGETEEIEVEGNVREDNAVREIVGEINSVENNITGWVVEHTYAEGTGPGEGGLVMEGEGNGVQIYVAQGSAEEDNGLTAEVETHTAGAQEEHTEETGGDSSAGEPKNEVVEGDGGEGDYAEGTGSDEGNLQE